MNNPFNDEIENKKYKELYSDKYFVVYERITE